MVNSKDPNTTKACELFVQKIPGRRKRRVPTHHSKAHWGGIQVGRRVRSVEQEGGGSPECAGKTMGLRATCHPHVGHFILPDPVLGPRPPQPSSRPCSERVSSCAERRVLGGHTPFGGAHLSLPILLTRSIYINSVSGEEEPRAPFPSKSAIKDSGEEGKLAEAPGILPSDPVSQ